MIIKVIGKRQFKSKKSGRDCLQVAYLSPMRGGEGESGDNLWLDPVQHPYESIKVGAEYNADFNAGGYLVGIQPVDF